MNTTTMSATRLLAIKTLDFIKECIINGDCSDEELQENMERMSIAANKDYINKNDYVNVEQAMKILNMKNRTKFFETMRRYGVANQTLNNQHIGYLRKEVEQISCILKLN
jgi:hypothetical protein